MKNYDFCIDIGSEYTTIYKKSSGIVLREPSIVLIEGTSKNLKAIEYGLNVKKYMGKLADEQVVVRPIVEGIIKNMDLTKKMLTYFLNKVISYKLVKPAINMVILLPVSLNQKQYNDYKDVFYSIGFNKLHFIYNAICASFADNPYYCINKANLFVNIGADKTELACIVNNKIIDACSVSVGGSNIDKKIVEYFRKVKNYTISESVACKIKEEIGSLYETDKSSMEVVAKDNATGKSISLVVTSKELLDIVYDIYYKIMQTIQAFLSDQSVEILQDIKNDGIIFYGGASTITGLEKFAKKVLKLSVFVVDNPEVFACLGSEKLLSNIGLIEKINDEN